MSRFLAGAAHELGESLAIGARRAMPAVLRKRQQLVCEIRGDRVDTIFEATRVTSGVYRLLHGLVDMMSDGASIVDAQVTAGDRGRARCRLSAGASGTLAPGDEVTTVMKRLQLTEAPHSGAERPGARQASGVCPATGMRIAFACRPGEGAVFNAALDVPLMARHRTLDAGGARAWVVDTNSFCGDALAARLQRRGWATTRFDSATAVERRLLGQSGSSRGPALLLVAEDDEVGAAQLARLRRSLPDSSRCVHLVASGSPALLRPLDADLRVAPLSPRDLDELAELAHAAAAPSGLTLPAPLRWVDRGRLLVVDDEPVNRIIATQIGGLLGFEVEAVDSGEKALEASSRAPPDVVMMDLRMPGLDGFATTRQLLAMQLRGLLPPFPIIAATTEDASIRRACEAVGMSGLLIKPLQIDAVRDLLLCQCSGCIPEVA